VRYQHSGEEKIDIYSVPTDGLPHLNATPEQ